SSSTVPAVGRSNPLRTFTSVDLPAPFGPISPAISARPSSRVTSRRACTPSNDRDTEEARSVSPGLLVVSAGFARPKRALDLGNLLGDDRSDDLRNVVLDPDDSVAAAEHRMQCLGEAHVAGDRRHVPELLHHLRERDALGRAVRALDRYDKPVARRGACDEAARSRSDLLG